MDKLVANLYAAVALSKADYQLDGPVSAEKLQSAIKESEALATVLKANVGDLLGQIAQGESVRSKLTPWQRELLEKITNSTLGRTALDQAARHADARTTVLLLYAISGGEESTRQFLENHPQATPLKAGLTEFFASLRREVGRAVNHLVYPQAALGFLLGGGIPLGLLAGWRLVVWLFRRPQSGQPPLSAG